MNHSLNKFQKCRRLRNDSKITSITTILLVLGFGVVKTDSQKWDIQLAYSATNYHSENATAFAAAVTEATGEV